MQGLQHYEDIAEQRGIQKGIQQGTQKEKIRNAVELLKAGADPIMVSHCLELPWDQVQEISVSVAQNAETRQILAN